MARLWSSGFELQSVTSGVEWNTYTATLSIDTTTKRSGAASLRAYFAANGTGNIRHRFRADSTDKYYVRFYLLVHTAPAAETIIFKTGDGSYNPIQIRLKTDRTLNCYLESGSSLGVSSALTVDTWYRVELSYDDVNANNTVTARLDGTQFATGNGDDVGGGGEIFLGSMTSTTCDIYFDDVAVNDEAAGGSSTSFPGAGSILHMHPNGAGDTAATTGTYADIDEDTPNDATDYITVDAVQEADYAFESFTEAGGGASDTITLVAVGTRQHPESAAASGWKCMIKSQIGGTELKTGTATTHNDTTWRSFGDAAPLVHKLVSYVDPQAGGAWTPTLLGTMIAGVDVTDATPHMFFSTIWVLVEYLPGVAAAGPANLKSRSGNLKANIKSMSGNLIANVKSLSGNS